MHLLRRIFAYLGILAAGLLGLLILFRLFVVPMLKAFAFMLLGPVGLSIAVFLFLWQSLTGRKKK